MTTQTVSTSFLTSGPTLQLDIPVELHGAPLRESPILLPLGGRYCCFTPSPRSEPDPEGLGYERLTSRYDRDGREMEVYRQPEDPYQLFVYWRLGSGIVDTHLRPEDEAVNALALVSECLSVYEDNSGIVVLFPDPPLKRAASRTPGYQESILFDSGPSQEPSQMYVELIRPGGLPQNGARKRSQGDGTLVALGTDHQLDLHVYGSASEEKVYTIGQEIRRSIRHV